MLKNNLSAENGSEAPFEKTEYVSSMAIVSLVDQIVPQAVHARLRQVCVPLAVERLFDT